MTSDFKIHAICVVKNEVDIIEACLRSAEQWADRIIVYDNKSDDGTWEGDIVKSCVSETGASSLNSPVRQLVRFVLLHRQI